MGNGGLEGQLLQITSTWRGVEVVWEFALNGRKNTCTLFIAT
jgi:hypothetical protein